MLGKPGEYLVKMNQDFVSGNEAFVSFLNLAQNRKLTVSKPLYSWKRSYWIWFSIITTFTRCTRKTVMEDYLLSNGFREKLNEK